MKALRFCCCSNFVSKIALVFGILSFLGNSSTQAEEYRRNNRWEIWTGSLVDYTKDLGSKNFSGSFLAGKSAIYPSIGYLFSEHFEAQLAPSFYLHSSGNYLGRIMAGVTGNFFGNNVADSYFGRVMLGFDDVCDNRKTDDCNFTLKTLIWSFSVGKRIELNPYISYSPELDFSVVKEDYSDINTISIVPLQFSLFF